MQGECPIQFSMAPVPNTCINFIAKFRKYKFGKHNAEKK